MKTLNRNNSIALVSAAVLALFLALSSSLSQPSAARVTIRDTVTVINSGSTNAIGYQLYIAPSGAVRYQDGSGEGQRQIPAALAQQFFRDLEAAMPLSQLPVHSCIRSISFGAAIVIEAGGERSPDLSCPGDAKTQALSRDVAAITKALNVATTPRNQE